MVRLTAVKEAFDDLARLFDRSYRHEVREHFGREQIRYDVRSSLTDMFLIPFILSVVDRVIEMTERPFRARFLQRSPWKLKRRERP